MLQVVVSFLTDSGWVFLNSGQRIELGTALGYIKGRCSLFWSFIDTQTCFTCVSPRHAQLSASAYLLMSTSFHKNRSILPYGMAWQCIAGLCIQRHAALLSVQLIFFLSHVPSFCGRIHKMYVDMTVLFFESLTFSTTT